MPVIVNAAPNAHSDAVPLISESMSPEMYSGTYAIMRFAAGSQKSSKIMPLSVRLFS